MAAQTPIEQFEQNRASSSPLTGRLDHPVLTTVIPARSERLSWGRFHTLVVVALGTTWIVHGLEVTLAGSVAGALKASPALNFSDLDVGALLRMVDRSPRPEKLFFITILVYLSATALTGLSWSAGSFYLFRFLTGAGIGGEYAAINSTIQELVPARYRGFTDLVINGSFWVGAALGAVIAVVPQSGANQS
jgi:MFS family permease